MFAKLKGNKSEIPLVIGNRTVNVAKFVSTSGTPNLIFMQWMPQVMKLLGYLIKKVLKQKILDNGWEYQIKNFLLFINIRPEIKDEVDSFVQALRKLSPK